MKKENKMQEPGARRVKLLQAACWGILFLVQIGMLCCLDTRAEEPNMTGSGELEGQLEIRSEWYCREEDCPIPPEQYDSEDDGVTYLRKHWETVMEVLPERLKTVEQERVFKQVEGMTPIPQEASFEVSDEGRTGTARTRAEAVTVEKETWSPDFSFPVVFHSCDAEYCQLGDQMIPYREEKPDFVGQEQLLLDIIGAPRDQYRVTDACWDGAVYLDEAGIPCRNAVASGEKLVRDYRVRYRGTARFPEVKRWQTVTVYERIPEETESGLSDSEVHVLQESGAEHAIQTEEEIPLWDRIIHTVRLIISLLLPILLILAVILVKRRKACYTVGKEQKTNPHRRDRES